MNKILIIIIAISTACISGCGSATNSDLKKRYFSNRSLFDGLAIETKKLKALYPNESMLIKIENRESDGLSFLKSSGDGKTFLFDQSSSYLQQENYFYIRESNLPDTVLKVMFKIKSLFEESNCASLNVWSTYNITLAIDNYETSFFYPLEIQATYSLFCTGRSLEELTSNFKEKRLPNADHIQDNWYIVRSEGCHGIN